MVKCTGENWAVGKVGRWVDTGTRVFKQRTHRWVLGMAASVEPLGGLLKLDND